MTLLSVDEARGRILSHFQPVATEELPLMECAHRVLAQDISATTDLPPFDNSSMDGFALRVADLLDASDASPRSLRVVADIPAGLSPTISLAPGEAARIMTGAQMARAGITSTVRTTRAAMSAFNAGKASATQIDLLKAAGLLL